MNIKTFFIAGTMQGSRRGDAQHDQSYRKKISKIILQVFPTAGIHCPAQTMERKLLPYETEIRQAHHSIKNEMIIQSDQYTPSLRMLTNMFHELVDLAAHSDICIAFLPDHEASMGTAVEMFAAKRARQCVIVVTQMKQNLCVLACADYIVPDLSALSELLHSIREYSGLKKMEA